MASNAKLIKFAKTVFFPARERGSFSCPLVGENPNPPSRASARLRVFLKTLFNCQAPILQNAVSVLLQFPHLRHDHNGVFCKRTGHDMAQKCHPVKTFMRSIPRIIAGSLLFLLKAVVLSFSQNIFLRHPMAQSLINNSPVLRASSAQLLL